MQIINKEEVASLINDNDTLLLGGFVGTGVPEELLIAIENSYLEKQKPQALNIIFCAGQGDGKDRGVNHLAHVGLVKKAIGGHFGLSPKMCSLINENKVEGYNLPQGILSHLIRASISKVPYIVSTVGLNTFVDPRLEGGKLNNISNEDLVFLINDNGKEYLKYPTFTPDVALLRGTYADLKGNIVFDKEALVLDSLEMAQAVKNHGGIVIVQVEKVVDKKFNPKDVIIPHITVDYVVECSNPINHMQTFGSQYNEAFVTSLDTVNKQEPAILNDRKIIARRAALELTSNDKILNYGIGIPEVIANVLNEEQLEHLFVPTVEPGIIGGTPQGGMDFGASKYPDMILAQSSQFDFYDGSGVDCAFLGLAQADKNGNLNVSKFGPKIAGSGGFINISQNAKKVIFCGTFMAGAKSLVKDNQLIIEKEGHTQKFIDQVEQVTFSGKFAIDKKLYVLYITERAVFDLNPNTGKLRLIEIAPGIDVEKDIISNMQFKPEISSELKLMDSSIFNEAKMELKIRENTNE